MGSITLNSTDVGMSVNIWDLVSQVIESRRDSRDIIREFLSNSLAQEVDAKNIKIIYYNDPQFGPSIIFSDDGIGMDYTGDMNKPGRLDKFMAVAYGAHAGFTSDEFGYKGLGSKLAQNCRRLEVKTCFRTNNENYQIFVDEPIKTLRENKQPVYKIIKGNGLSSSGTEIKVLGYEYGENSRLYTKDKLLTYLYFNTIVGNTKERTMPKITLKVENDETEIKTGFRYIIEPTPKNWKTYAISKPIEKVVDRNGKSVKVILKGGYTLETGDTILTNDFTLRSGTCGLFLSIKGIPYVQLDINAFRGTFSTLQYKFCRFVAECDGLFDHMDFARNSYLENETTRLFEEALRGCFKTLSETPEYKNFLKEREEQTRKNERESLDKRREVLQKADQKYVYYNNNKIHRVPTNEHDTLALLWKLEGAKGLPFDHFISLEHTPQAGIDIISEYRELATSQTKYFAPIEVEHEFENFILHGHSAQQVEAIICWDINDEVDCRKDDEKAYKYYGKINGQEVPIFVLSKIDKIDIRTSAGVRL
jgi:cellulose synthase/poly-beta-1,6-N-acetylglucosamine synthase-like glycosyltransferase